MKQLVQRWRQPAWFVAVGTAAAAVHWAVAVALVEAAAWPPMVANVAGWLVAFSVSFSGHAWLTFAGHGAPLLRAAGRMFVLSAAGMAINAAAYAALLRMAWLRYDIALALVLLSVAALTYLASRHWAFARR